MKYIKNTTNLDLELQFEGNFYELKAGDTQPMKPELAEHFTKTAAWCVEVDAPAKEDKKVKEDKKEVDAPAKEDKEVK